MVLPPKPGKPAEDGKGAFVLNPITKKSKVYGMIDGMRICKIIKGLTIPLNDEHQVMCIAYHYHDGCYTQCKRSNDHWPQKLSEAQQLSVFLEVAIATNKPKAWWGGQVEVGMEWPLPRPPESIIHDNNIKQHYSPVMTVPRELKTSKWKPLAARSFSEAELGMYARNAATEPNQLGWDARFTKTQGLKCMSWQFTAWQHLAIPALLQLQCHGAPKVLSDSP